MKLFKSKGVDPAPILATDGGDPKRDPSTASAAETQVQILASLTWTKILGLYTFWLEWDRKRLSNSARRYGMHLDPDGAIRRAMGLAIRAHECANETVEATFDRVRRIPAWLKTIAVVVIIGLEAAFVATYFYQWVEQGGSWLSIQGLVSLLVGLVHPIVVASLGIVLATVRVRGIKNTSSRLLTFLVMGFLIADLAALYFLSGFIVEQAVKYAVENGAEQAQGFPVPAVQALFVLLPVLLVMLDWVDADPAYAQGIAEAKKVKQAFGNRDTAVKLAHRRAKHLDRDWLATESLVVRIYRVMSRALLSAEYAIVAGRVQSGIGVAAQPAAIELGDKPLDALRRIQVALENVKLMTIDHIPRAVVTNLHEAVAQLLATPRPTSDLVDQKIAKELGGPANVSDPSSWKPFIPQGVEIEQSGPAQTAPLHEVPPLDNPEDEAAA